MASESSASNGFTLLFIVAIVIHLIDIFLFNFGTSTGILFARATIYLVALSLPFYLSIEGEAEHKLKASLIPTGIVVLFFPIFLWIINLAPVDHTVQETLHFLMFIIPIWPIYLALNSGSGALQTLLKAYIFLLVAGAIVVIIGLYGSEIPQTPGLDIGRVDFERAWTGFREVVIDNTFQGISSIISGARTEIDTRINESLGRGYQGDVERVSSDTGITIQRPNIRSSYSEDDIIRISIPVRVRTFKDNDTDIAFECSATSGRTRVLGNVTPNIETFRGFDTRTVFCEFENLSRGTYRFEFTANFEFETWGYTELYFVSATTIEQLFEGGERIDARAFGIPRMPRTTYTTGPVFLGTNNSQEMPLEVHSDRDTYIYLDWGVENANRLYGDINRINHFEVSLPSVFNLDSDRCNLPISSSESDTSVSDLYTLHRFEYDGTGRILSLGCEVTIPVSQRGVIVSDTIGSLTEVTVLSKVNYDYSLRALDTIRVT